MTRSTGPVDSDVLLVGRPRSQRPLPVSSAAPVLARQAVESVPELAHLPDLRFAAKLLASELTANSVRHAALGVEGSIVLSVECDAETVHVEVTDGSYGFDALGAFARHRRTGEKFHGISLVHALADRWGFRRGAVGSSIWFEIDLIPGRRPWRGREPVADARPVRRWRWAE